jgi:hypothetical protein
MKDKIEQRSFFLSCIYKCLSRDCRLWIICFVSNQEFDNFFKRIFYTLTCLMCIFFFFIRYTSHLLAYILCICIYTNSYSPYSDRSTLDKWLKVNINDIESYVIIIFCPTFFIFLYMTRWRNNVFHAESVLYVSHINTRITH